jgi:hypothetical protein
VPNLFQLTLTFSFAASARWALVGAILPARLSKSLRLADCVSSTRAIESAAPGRTTATSAAANAAAPKSLSRICSPLLPEVE